MTQPNLDRQFDLAMRRDDARDSAKPDHVPDAGKMVLENIESPRWAGGPPICEMENLPYFETQEALLAAHNANRKGNPIYEGQPLRSVWRCRFCAGWHATYGYRDPSGASSGTGRGAKHRG